SARSCLIVLCLNSGELLLPFPGELFAGFVTDLTDGRKTVAPFIGSHGFDDHARVVTFLTLLNDRIEGAAPGTTQNINRGRRLGDKHREYPVHRLVPCRYRPWSRADTIDTCYESLV